MFSLFCLMGVWIFICICNGIDFLMREIKADKRRVEAQSRFITRCDPEHTRSLKL